MNANTKNTQDQNEMKIRNLLEYCKPFEYIFVDLDGTLVEEELMRAFFIKTLYTKPWISILAALQRARGLLRSKKWLATRIKKWTYRAWLIDALTELSKDTNKKIILITGSHQILGERATAGLNFLNGVFGSDLETHMVKHEKIKLMDKLTANLEITNRDIEKKYCYIGNSWDDSVIFNEGVMGCIITKDKKLQSFIKQNCKHVLLCDESQ